MDKNNLCLTWNEHGSTYQRELAQLRNDNILTDVTLACEGRNFFAHKLVLVTCSEFFKSILGDVPCQHPIVFLKGIDPVIMEALIDFMYIGRVNFPKNDLRSLMATAKTLQIKGLGAYRKEPQDRPATKRKRAPGPNKEKPESSKSSHGGQSDGKRRCGGLVEANERIFDGQTFRDENDGDFLGDLTASALSSVFSLPSSQHPTETPLVSNDYHTLLNESSSGGKPIIIKASSQFSIVGDTTSHSNHSVILESSQATSSEVHLIDEPFGYQVNKVPTQNGIEIFSIPSSEKDSGIVSKIEDTSVPGFVKEEPLDCSQGSCKAREQPTASSSLPNALSEGLTSKDNTSQTDHLEKMYQNVDQNFSRGRIQDENNENGRPFVCPICQKDFAKAAILKRHHLAHFRPYGCHLCPRSFTRREVLAEHVLEHNGADLRLPCPVCNMTIKRKRNLQAHIKVKHPEYYHQRTSSDNTHV